MSEEEILILYRAINSENGRIILQKAKDYMVSLSQSNAQAEWIKGIGKVIGYLEETNSQFEKLKTKKEKINE